MDASVKCHAIALAVTEIDIEIKVIRPAMSEEDFTKMTIYQRVRSIHEDSPENDTAPFTPCRHNSPTKSEGHKGVTGSRSAA